MTSLARSEGRNFKIPEWVMGGVYALIFLSFLIVSATNAETVRRAVEDSIVFCASTVIPSIFPFMVLSDMLASAFHSGKGSGILSRFFGVSDRLFGALTVGNVCGFPIGVKVAAKLYEDGKITKEELEDSIGLMNNASAPFVISAIGACIYGSVFDGILLYSAILFSTLIVALSFRQKRKENHFSKDNTRQRFDIAESIRSAGLSAVAVCSYIIFFSYLSSLISLFIKNDYLVAILASFTEISGGVRLIGALGLPRIAALPLTALVLGFSGVSVHLQAFGMLPVGISKKRYFYMKICEGAFAMMLAFLLCVFTR